MGGRHHDGRKGEAVLEQGLQPEVGDEGGGRFSVGDRFEAFGGGFQPSWGRKTALVGRTDESLGDAEPGAVGRKSDLLAAVADR
jgi:hypothetical protein